MRGLEGFLGFQFCRDYDNFPAVAALKGNLLFLLSITSYSVSNALVFRIYKNIWQALLTGKDFTSSSNWKHDLP